MGQTQPIRVLSEDVNKEVYLMPMKYLHLIESGDFHEDLAVRLSFLHILILQWRAVSIFKVFVLVVMYFPSCLYTLCLY